MNQSSTRSFIAYLRVSTVRQDTEGVSLTEQRRAIEEFATSRDFMITSWYTEVQSAAKGQRRVFQAVITRLKNEKDLGLLLHRIDRGARNLWDWAELGSLIDHGTEIHFVHDNLDLHSRGGRLAADIQAVIAADYIRNLRDETMKGMRGRFRQGLYPLAAPLGYLDRGGGKPKVPDPDRAGHIQTLFALYCSGAYSFDTLRNEMIVRCLRNRHGRLLARSSFSRILHNPFYAGTTILRRTGECFIGRHEPLISQALFDEVQWMLRNRYRHRTHVRRHHLWSRRLRCDRCRHLLIGESQRSHVYYRCHTRSCSVTCLREERIDSVFASALTPEQRMTYKQCASILDRERFIDDVYDDGVVHGMELRIRLKKCEVGLVRRP